jgi:NADPH2:quinone reductase
MNVMMRKRLRILGFTLRAQSVNEKRALIKRFRARWLPALESGAIKPIVHATFPLEHVSEAHAMLERNENFGKIVLTID